MAVSALALSCLDGACAQQRDRRRAYADYPSADQSVLDTTPSRRQAVRETGPWIRVQNSGQREQLDTTSIIRTDSTVYEGWFRRPMQTEQGSGESYHTRYQIDCLAGLVRTTQAAVYGEKGELKERVSAAELERSGDDRWWSVARSRDLAAVVRTLCDRASGTDLPISREHRP